MRRIAPEAVLVGRRSPVDPEALSDVIPIVEDVRSAGEEALARHAARLGDGDVRVFAPVDLAGAFDTLAVGQQQALQASAERIRSFARAQRDSVSDVTVQVPGGQAGHQWTPVNTVGAYAPGGRHLTDRR